MLIAQFLGVIERLAPAELAEDWDNVGLMVGRHNHAVRRVLVALELRDEVLAEARERDCDAILTHHPPIFPTISAVTDAGPPGSLILAAAEERRAVICAHTNLDAAAGGLNDEMATTLGLREAAPLVPADSAPALGLGRVGRLASPASLERFVVAVGAAYGGARLRYVGDPGTRVERVACCTGSGRGLIDAARASGADAFVTCDLTYHDADRATDLPLIGLHHAEVERHALRRWTRTLERALAGHPVEVLFAATDTDPWQQA